MKHINKLTKIYGKVILVAIPLLIIAAYSYTKYNADIHTQEDINSEIVQVLNKSAKISELQNWDIIATMLTSKGKIKIKLYPDTAPKTVTNFLVHAQEGYYDNLIFHRVIDNFMIQWGDPLGTGIGWESIYGWSFEDEFFWNTENDAGTIAMANSGPATNGSQFFINERANNHLDNKHTVFWKVIEWMDVVDKITQVPMDVKTSKPYTDIVIEKIELVQYIDTEFNEYKIADIKQAKIDAQANFDSLNLGRIEKNNNKSAQSWDTVEVKYELKLSDGKVIDGNFDKEDTLKFTVDQQWIIPGFSNAVKWMKIWDSKSIIIEAIDAYGEENITLTMQDFQQFKDAWIEIAKGEIITVGEWVTTTIIDIQWNTVIATNPHQLAGQQLFFEIELKYFVN
jgi:peptidyl-prolyl cis-trans isomerase B (cyclophilin B)